MIRLSGYFRSGWRTTGAPVARSRPITLGSIEERTAGQFTPVAVLPSRIRTRRARGLCLPMVLSDSFCLSSIPSPRSTYLSWFRILTISARQSAVIIGSFISLFRPSGTSSPHDFPGLTLTARSRGSKGGSVSESSPKFWILRPGR